MDTGRAATVECFVPKVGFRVCIRPYPRVRGPCEDARAHRYMI